MNQTDVNITAAAIGAVPAPLQSGRSPSSCCHPLTAAPHNREFFSRLACVDVGPSGAPVELGAAVLVPEGELASAGADHRNFWQHTNPPTPDESCAHSNVLSILGDS